MTQATENDRLNHIEQRLENSENRLGHIEESLSSIENKLDKLSTDVEKSNDKFEIYRQANQSLVNLAFGLIASATVGLVVSLIFKR
ncbi:MAG: hypothetical protein WBB28_15790 [Crinalium sp.]